MNRVRLAAWIVAGALLLTAGMASAQPKAHADATGPQRQALEKLRAVIRDKHLTAVQLNQVIAENHITNLPDAVMQAAGGKIHANSYLASWEDTPTITASSLRYYTSSPVLYAAVSNTAGAAQLMTLTGSEPYYDYSTGSDPVIFNTVQLGYATDACLVGPWCGMTASVNGQYLVPPHGAVGAYGTADAHEESWSGYNTHWEMDLANGIAIIYPLHHHYGSGITGHIYNTHTDVH